MTASILSIFKGFQENRGRRQRKGTIGYDQIECKRLLAFAAPPATTTDIDTFIESTEDAIVRVDEDDSRLVIRLDGDENYVEINVDFGYLKVNRIGTGPVLEIQPDRYDTILVLGNGNDKLRVVGNDLRAQLHPNRTWVTTRGVGIFGSERGAVSVQGINLEEVSIEDNPLIDAGPSVFGSDNIIRFYGSDGDDHLTMTSNSQFQITTGVTMVGEGYRYHANSFARLNVFAGGGNNRAGIIGTRAIGTEDNPTGFGLKSDGVDRFFATDNFARIRNEFFEAQFTDFGTTRVDLLSGDDRAHVVDTEADRTFYNVDGESLVGNFRRFTNVERITIDGSAIADDTVRTTGGLDGSFSQNESEARYNFQRQSSGEEEDFGLISQVVPANYFWAWQGFEDFVV